MSVKIVKYSVSIFLIVHFILYANANEKTDSLLRKYQESSSDTVKIKLLIDIGNLYKFSNADTAIYYFERASVDAEKSKNKKFQALAIKSMGIVYDMNHNYKKAIDYYEKSLLKFIEIDDISGISACNYNIGHANFNLNDYSKARELIERSLSGFVKLKDAARQANCYTELANILFMQGNYTQAINQYQNAQKKFEEIGSKSGVANSYNNIGNIYYRQRNFTQAFDCYNNALSKYQESGNETGVVICYNNLGLISNDQKAYKKAVDYFQKALEISEKSGNRKDLVICYSNIGMSYYSEKKLGKAVEYLNKSLVICEETGDMLKTALTLGNIAKIYNTLGDSSSSINEKKKYFHDAIKYALRSDSIAESIGALYEKQQAYTFLSASYEGLGDYKTSLHYHILYTTIKDTLVNMETNRLVSDMSAKYESEKKELQIGKLSKEKELQLSENKKQRIIIFAFIAGFIIILIFSILLYRLFLQKKHANILLAEQNDEISMQKEEITLQKGEIDASIQYAKRIQTAILPQLEHGSQLVKEMFIMFKPKDVVSGDFYFMKYIERSNVIIAAAADCTGHGVPGAFMSMLGVTFLNEICSKPEVQHADEVLEMLKNYVINSLHQTGKEGEQKDGMDIALVVIFFDSKTIEFAGANNPLYYVHNGELTEYKADRMPVGIHPKAGLKFTNNSIQYHDGDCFYLFSDGFIDQFGGEKHKKYLSKNFREFLFSIHAKPMHEQLILVENESVSWRGETEQIDDQLVIGIRL